MTVTQRLRPKAKELKAVAHTTKRTNYLGLLLWTTVPERPIPSEGLRAALEATGLGGYAPGKIGGPDAFRRAVQQLVVHRQPVDPDDPKNEVWRNLLLADAARQHEGKVVKAVKEDLVRGKDEVLATQTLGYLRFSPEIESDAHALRASGADQSDPAARDLFNRMWKAADGAAIHPDVLHHLEQVPVLLAKALTEHTDETLRGITHRVLATMAPISMRPSGAVWFVPWQHRRTVASLEALYGRMDDLAELPEGSYLFTSIPVIDSASQRVQIQRGAHGEAKALLDKLTREINDTLAGSGRITPGMAAQFAARMDYVRNLAKTYEGVLERNLDEISATMETVHGLVVKVMAKVEA